MFRWLTAKFTGKKKKETEVRLLKEEACNTVKELKTLAKQGDPVAQERLKKVEETITEQSIRLTGHKKPPSTAIFPPGTMHP